MVGEMGVRVAWGRYGDIESSQSLAQAAFEAVTPVVIILPQKSLWVFKNSQHRLKRPLLHVRRQHCP
jgi:hypothetical protein